MRQKLELVVLMEKQYECRNVTDIRQVETSPAVATFQVGRVGRTDTLHPCFVQNPSQLLSLIHI